MSVSYSALWRACYLFIFLSVVSCKKEQTHISCADSPTSAQFRVNNHVFDALEVQEWLRNGTQNSLQFMQQLPNGNQHVVIIMFNGDTAGQYPLLGINAAHRASYFAPGINATIFPDTVLPGLLEITSFEHELSCLSGSYSFLVDSLQIHGEFQQLRVN